MESEKHRAEGVESEHHLEAINAEEASQSTEQLINASGHVQELDRRLGFWSLFGIGIMTDNAWAAGGESLLLALYNGGGPGVIWEFVFASFFYIFVSAGIAELASAVPSSASVYHWASITGGPRYGRVLSFYAGWWAYLSWLFGCASACLAQGNIIVAMYALYHPDYTLRRWHVYIVFLAVNWLSSCVILFSQRYLVHLSILCACACAGGWLITVLTCAIMPSRTGYGYASNSFVWTDWNNQTGWSSSGFVFLAGTLNGAFAIGTPDVVSHLAEEVTEPRKNIPRGIFAQLLFGFVTTFTYYLALLYAITSLSDVASSPIQNLPLAAIYQQATRSNAGTMGLLFVFFLSILFTVNGCYVTTTRMLWTLGRDNATPWSMFVGKVNERWKNPFNAILVNACILSVLGVIYIGSLTAFNAILGVFTIFLTMAYLAAFLPHILSGRKYVKPGQFWMSTPVAYSVTGIACVYMIVSNVIFCFPFTMPTSAATMNYSSLLTGGITLLLTFWYLWKRNHGYCGPVVMQTASDNIVKGQILTGEDLEKDRIGNATRAEGVTQVGRVTREKESNVTRLRDTEAV